MSENLFVTAQQTGPIRTVELQGREHRVIPATLVREQVLNNNLGATLLPADEIERSVAAWNDMPVVIRHPRKRGVPVSARSPDVLNSRGVGRVFNARFEDGELKAEVFVDMERAKAVEDAGQVVNRVEKGEPGELSTGFATRTEERQGTFDGDRFEAVLRDIQPDHLALLVDEKGACSVGDGCGLGVNCTCGSDDMDEETANNVADTLWDRLKAFLTRESAMNDEQVTALHEATGLSKERLAEMEDEEIEALASNVLTDEGEEEAEDEPAENEEAGSDDEVAAKIAELEEQVAELAAGREEEREALVEKLADNDRCPFEKAELEDRPLDELEKLARMAKVTNYAGRGGPKTTATNDEPEFAPVRPYWADNEDNEED